MKQEEREVFAAAMVAIGIGAILIAVVVWILSTH